MIKDNINKKSFTLLDYYLVFIKYKKILLFMTSGFLIVSSIMYFLIIDPLFLSESTVKSTAKGNALAGMFAATGIAALGDVTDLAGGGTGATELALYETILLSRKCIEETILKFDLMEENKEKYMQEAVKHYREEYIELTKDKIAGTLTIGVYNKNPQKAKDIVDFLVYQLNKINVELSVQNAKNNREFIEGRYKQIKQDLTFAEDSLQRYQEQFGIAPDITVKAAVQTEIMLEGDIKSEEIKLDLLKKMLSPNQTEVLLQDEKIAVMKSKLDEIRNSSDNNSSLKLHGKPEVVMNFLRLQRNVEIHNKILAFILPIYEQAKIDEKKDTPVVLILDQSSLPEKKTKPKRLLMISIITLFGFIVTYTGLFMKDKIQELYRQSNEKV